MKDTRGDVESDASRSWWLGWWFVSGEETVGVLSKEPEDGRGGRLLVSERRGIAMLCMRAKGEFEGAPDAACIDMPSNGSGEVLLNWASSSSSFGEDEARADFPARNTVSLPPNESDFE